MKLKTSFARFLASMFLLMVAVPQPAKAEWRRAESPNFVVFSQSSESRIREQILELETFDRLLRLLSPARSERSPNKLNIYFVRSMGQLQRHTGIGAGIAGFYTANPRSILAVVDESENRTSRHNSVLFHEYGHHFTLQYYAAAYPRWYTEGFAEYVGSTRIDGSRVDVGQLNSGAAPWAADREGWIPYERVLFENSFALSPEQQARFYAQSWYLVHYLLRDPARRRALHAYLSALNRGEEQREAFNRSFGIDVKTMERALRSYWNNMTFTRIQLTEAEGPPPITVETLPRSADDMLPFQIVLEMGVGAANQDAFVARVRRAAARHTDTFAQRVAARTEVLYGDAAAGERVLDALLASTPNDADLLFLRGMRHYNAGQKHPSQQREQFRLARNWFAQAHRANDNHFPTLFYYAQSYSSEPDFVSENTENILLLAQQLAPQVPAIRLAAARMLMMRNKFEGATALLLPLASSPHEGADSRAAQTLLEAARQRQQPPSETADEEVK